MRTLWDLIKRHPADEPRAQVAVRPARVHTRTASGRPSAAQRYETMTRDVLKEHGVRVRKWRSSMSGVAWQVKYSDGSIARLIEAPRPKGPMSAAVFLHEIGHHAIGFNRYSPRCLEEYHAWAWSLREMERRGLTVTDRVRQRMADSLAYAVAKAQRRGLKRVPEELKPFERSRPHR